MIFKKKYLLFTVSIIIIFQILLYTNNKQRTSFKYFKWTIKEVSIGRLISISFFSGFCISALLNTLNTNYKKSTYENIGDDFESSNNEENKSYVEIPPQRDIRDAQPTISVNYRVVRDMEENNLKNDQNYSNKFDNKDDWDNDNDDW